MGNRFSEVFALVDPTKSVFLRLLRIHRSIRIAEF
jgi:hypothetical protein